MAIYRLKAIARSPSHNAVFKAGKAFDRIEAFFVSGEDPPGTAFRPPLEGTLQPGVRAPMLHRLDYLPSFCGIPMFSAAFVQAMGDVLRNEVELHPCTSCAKTDRTTGTSRGCCEGYACSNRSHRAPAMAPCDRSAITCTDLHENVFLACETRRATAAAMSSWPATHSRLKSTSTGCAWVSSLPWSRDDKQEGESLPIARDGFRPHTFDMRGAGAGAPPAAESSPP